MVYPDDSFGSSGLADAQKARVTAKRTPVVVEKFNRSNLNFTAMTPLIYKSNAQAAIMIVSGQAVVERVKAIRAAGSAAQIVTLLNNASNGFRKPYIEGPNVSYSPEDHREFDFADLSINKADGRTKNPAPRGEECARHDSSAQPQLSRKAHFRVP